MHLNSKRFLKITIYFRSTLFVCNQLYFEMPHTNVHTHTHWLCTFRSVPCSSHTGWFVVSCLSSWEVLTLTSWNTRINSKYNIDLISFKFLYVCACVHFSLFYLPSRSPSLLPLNRTTFSPIFISFKGFEAHMNKLVSFVEITQS